MATIIIQENDSAVLDVLTQALALENFRPIPILGCCPKEMLDLIRKNHPDLVIMDYRANRNDGLVLLEAIRKVSRYLPVLAISCDLNIAKVANGLGFDGYVAKPFDLDELFRTVNSFLAGTSK